MMTNATVGLIPKPRQLTTNTNNELVIVVGAGITGLSTAWFLQRQGYEVLVLEASACLGGNIQTVAAEGYQFERGPNSFINNRPAMQELIEGLGLQDELLVANAAAHKRYIAKNGNLMALPSGLASALKTPVLSLPAKLRLLLEPFVGKAKTEETITQFTHRRLGQEAFNWLVDPFVSGIFAGDPAQLSAKAALPRLYALEKQYGSLFKGALALRRDKKTAVQENQADPYLNKMLNFKGGMHQLMASIADGLINPVQCNVEVDKVTYSQQGVYLVQSGDSFWQTKKLVVALPAMQVARLMNDLPSHDPNQWQQAQTQLASIAYPALANISMAFKKQHVQHPLDGFGALFPSKENRQTLGALFPSSIFSGRAPADEHVLTAFIGGVKGTSAMQMDTASRLELVLGELRSYLGITGDPLWHVESLWPASIPQYHVGHQQKIAQIDKALQHLHNFYICGNWRDGVSLSDCVTNSKLLAQRIADEHLGSSDHG